jgi:hypothetical protein
VYFMRLESVVRQIRIRFDSVRRLQLTTAERLGIVALGGYRRYRPPLRLFKPGLFEMVGNPLNADKLSTSPSLLRVMEEPLGAAYGFLVHYMGVTHGLVVEVRECDADADGARVVGPPFSRINSRSCTQQHFKVRDVDGALPSSGDTAEEEDTDQPALASPGTSSSSSEDLASAHFPSFLEKCSFPHMETKFGELRDNMGATSALLDVVRTWHTLQATTFHQIARLADSVLAAAAATLEQLVQGLTVVAVLPPSADHPYEELTVVDTLIPESVPWRSDLQPYHMGYEVRPPLRVLFPADARLQLTAHPIAATYVSLKQYNKELASYVKQLNIFFAATGKSHAMGNFVTRQTMFSSCMLKYALSPKEAARQVRHTSASQPLSWRWCLPSSVPAHISAFYPTGHRV